MSKKLFKIIYIFLCGIIVFTKEVYGYLDPSAMTYLIQILLFVGITVATSVGVFFYKIKRKIKKDYDEEDDEEDDE